MLIFDRRDPFDHRLDVTGGARVFGLANVEPVAIALEALLVAARDVPGALPRPLGRALHLVLARIGVAGQVADIGDVDHVAQVVARPAQRAAERVGEDVGAHVADMLIGIDCRPASVDTRLAIVDRLEGFELACQRVEQAKLCHARRFARGPGGVNRRASLPSAPPRHARRGARRTG